MKPDYEKTLDKLAAMLRRKSMTAKAIAKALKCCKPSAYHRLAALSERGEKLETETVRESSTGPSATAYRLSPLCP